MNQAVFPTVWKASNQSKTWSSSLWTSATSLGQSYKASVTQGAKARTLILCSTRSPEVHTHQEWVKKNPQNRPLNCQQNVSTCHETVWIFKILFLKLVREQVSLLLDGFIRGVPHWTISSGLLSDLKWNLTVHQSNFQKKVLSAGTIATWMKSCESPLREQDNSGSHYWGCGGGRLDTTITTALLKWVAFMQVKTRECGQCLSSEDADNTHRNNINVSTIGKDGF